MVKFLFKVFIYVLTFMSDIAKTLYLYILWGFWNKILFWKKAVHKSNQKLGKETIGRSSRPEVFLRKVVLKICSKLTGEHPRQGVISIKLLCNFIGIAFRHGCPPVNLLHIFRIPFPTNTSGWLLLDRE